MGKREVRVVRVRKSVTLVLLLLTTAAIIALFWFLSGRAYAGKWDPLRALWRRDSYAPGAMLAYLMPVLANLLLFVPWGFLLFIVADRPERRRRLTYVLAFAGGLVFATGMHLWQLTLPTRVTSLGDAFVNALGALMGAVLGHLRKQVRVRFEY